MFLVLVYFHKTHVSVSLSYPCSWPNPLSLLVSLSFPHCADKQPGAMAAEEVTCGIFSGVLFANVRLCLSPRLRGVLMWCHYLLFICAVIEIILILTQFFHVVHLINMGLPSIKSISMNLVLLDGESKKKKKSGCQFSFVSILSQCSTCNIYKWKILEMLYSKYIPLWKKSNSSSKNMGFVCSI